MFGTGSPAQTLEMVTEAIGAQGATKEIQSWGISLLKQRAEVEGPETQSRIAELGGIELVIDALRAHPKAKDIQEHCLACLGCLGRELPENIRRIDANDGVEVILVALRKHAKLGQVQGWGFFALRNLAVNTPEVQSQLLVSDVIELAIAALKAHPEVPHVQGCGCAVLGILSTGHVDVRQKIARLGGIDAILDALEHHPEVVKVQGCGWASLGNLVSDSKPTRERFVKLGGAELVLDALRTHPAEADIQACGVTALRNLTCEQTDYMERIVSNGGIELVCSALHSQLQDLRVQLSGVAILQFLMGEDVDQCHGNQERIMKCAGGELVVKAMAGYPESLKLLMSGTEALRRLARENVNGQNRVEQVSGIEALLNLMEAQPQCMALQLSCCRALWSVSALGDTVCERITRAGIEPMLAAMEAFPQNVDLQDTACATQEMLLRGKDGWCQNGWFVSHGPACSPSQRHLMVGLSAMDLVVHAMDLHPKMRDLQEHAGEALVRFTRNAERCRGMTSSMVRARLVGLQGIEIVMKCMKEQLAARTVQEFLLPVLTRLIGDRFKNRCRVFELEGVELLLHVMQQHPDVPSIQAFTCEALYTLAHDGHGDSDDYAPSEVYEETPPPTPYSQMGDESRVKFHLGIKDPPRYIPPPTDVPAESIKFRAQMVEQNCMENTLNTLREHPNESEVQRWGLLVLLQLSDDEEDFRSRLFVESGTEAGIKALETYLGTHIEIQETASAILRRLCCESESYARSVVELGGVELIAKVMAAHPEEKYIQAYGCRVLQKCGVYFGGVVKAESEHEVVMLADGESLGSMAESVVDDVLIEERLDRCGVIELTVKAMANHLTASEVQESGCSLITVLSKGAVDLRTRFYNLDCISLIAKAMRQHTFLDLQQFACEALEVMSTEFGCMAERKTINEVGCVELMLQAMKMHPCAQSRAPALAVLRGLVYDGEGVTDQLLTTDGLGKELFGPDLVIAALKAHPLVEVLQTDGTTVLASMANNEGHDYDSCNRIVALDGIELVLRSMNHFAEAERLQEFGCALLQSLARDSHIHRETYTPPVSKIRLRIADAKGIETLTRLILQHKKNKSIAENGCAAMDQVLHNEDANYARAVECNAIKSLLIAMSTNPKAEVVNERALSSLWHLGNVSGKGASLIGSQGGGQIIVAAIKAFPEAVRLCYCGCGALAAICADSHDRRDRIVMLKGMELVYDALKRHLANPVAAAYACACLFAFTKDRDDFVEELFNLGGYEICGAAMKAHPKDEQVQYFGSILRDVLRPDDADSDEDEDDVE